MSSVKRKVIYIAGLYHSGSTLFDRALSSKANIYGFGEIHKLAKDGPEELCTCGKLVNDCSFWAPLLKNQDSLNPMIFYDKFYEKIKNQLPDVTILDSSKCHPFRLFNRNHEHEFRGLEYWRQQEDVDLYVVHLVRDPKSWVASLRRRDERMKENKEEPILRRFLHFETFRFFQWLIGHWEISKYLNAKKLPYIKASYEEFCSGPEKITKDILSFCGITDSSLTLNLGDAKSHICVGNPSRNDRTKNHSVRYDTRWIIQRSSFQLFFWTNIFYPLIRRITDEN